MSNKPKGVAIHPNNIISAKDKAYTSFIRSMVSHAKIRLFLGKHVGSKSPRVLKQRING